MRASTVTSRESSCLGRLRSLLRQRPLHDQVLLDDPAADEVLLDDLFQHRRIATGVPGALGIDDRDRPAGADPQAVGLGAIDTAVRRSGRVRSAGPSGIPRPPAIARGPNSWALSGRNRERCAGGPAAHRPIRPRAAAAPTFPPGEPIRRSLWAFQIHALRINQALTPCVKRT